MGMGASVDNLSLVEFMSNATKMANGLRSLQSFYDLEAIVCYRDPVVIAEAVGCPIDQEQCRVMGPPRSWAEIGKITWDPEQSLTESRLSVSIDVVSRLSTMLPETILVGYVTGPLSATLLISARDEDAAVSWTDNGESMTRLLVSYCKGLGEAGLDLLVIEESAAVIKTAAEVGVASSLLAPLWNTASFYGLNPLLSVKDWGELSSQSLPRFVDGLCVRADVWSSNRDIVKRTGILLPPDIVLTDTAAIHSVLRQNEVVGSNRGKYPFLVATENDVPVAGEKDLTINALRELRHIFSV